MAFLGFGGCLRLLLLMNTGTMFFHASRVSIVSILMIFSFSRFAATRKITS